MRLGEWEVDSVQNVDALTLLKGLPDGCIDLVVTSPPYDNLRTYNGYSFDFEPIAQESYRVLKQGGVLVWVVGDETVNGSETLTSFKQALYFVETGFNMHDTMIWQKLGVDPPHKPFNRYGSIFEYMFVLSKGAPKTANVPRHKLTGTKRSRGRRNPDGTIRYDISNNGGGVYPNVWKIGQGISNRDDYTNHPAVFPQSLAERHILTWSNAGDVVLDYFGGSGTTSKMARNNGRHWLTCDVSAEYCDLMRRRLALPYTPPLFADAAFAPASDGADAAQA